MTRFNTVLGAAVLALAFGAAAAVAQTTTPGTGTAAAKSTTPATGAGTAATKRSAGRKVSTTAAGKKCSDDADAKNLHGKERSKFRSTCKREFNASAKKA